MDIIYYLYVFFKNVFILIKISTCLKCVQPSCKMYTSIPYYLTIKYINYDYTFDKKRRNAKKRQKSVQKIKIFKKNEQNC